MTRPLTPDDDGFHAVASDDPMWTETTWWGFSVPERPLGGMVYAFFRPNVGVATMVVQVWDAEAVEPWRSPYARQMWHLPMPDDLTDASVGPLRMQVVEPLTAYRLTYDDGDALAFDLEWRSAAPARAVAAEEAFGHVDHLCRVTGDLVLAGRTVAVDGLAMRDRSWYVREDRKSARSGYTYGAVDGNDHFLVFSRASDGEADDYEVFGGHLCRAGVTADVVSGAREVVSRRRGHPDEVEVTATDAEGRSVEASGRVTAALASQSTPGMFAWMSVADWDIDGRSGHGEDHDVWSPDHLARAPR